ncbi:radical SAM protein [Magnetovibrio sp. PR-2]|uniref:radical SAM protein n=1 Tax=Magnetovibrio sp. PR-2 TaxID=3120356 RepID=UPI002FCE62F3
MPEGQHERAPIDPAKFQDPLVTAKGEIRATVGLSGLKTLWFNTGSLCNITCDNCYMDSSPTNDDLVYLAQGHVQHYLEEIATNGWSIDEIGFTGGEPFMNKDLVAMLHDVLDRGFKALVLTNAMKPLWQKRNDLLAVKSENLTLRVSVDHYTQGAHENIRGDGTWPPMVEGIKWLIENGFQIDIAGRTLWDETEEQSRQGYQQLFDAWGLKLNAADPTHLVLFPEMDAHVDVPEITTQCWGILNVRPDAMMCATSRMVVHRKGEASPSIAPCTLLPYDTRFDLGKTLVEAHTDVALNHPHCAKFCVLGGASCSA